MTNDKKEMMLQCAAAIWECRKLFAQSILAHDDSMALAAAVRWRENVAVAKALVAAQNPEGTKL